MRDKVQDMINDMNMINDLQFLCHIMSLSFFDIMQRAFVIPKRSNLFTMTTGM